MPGVFGFIAAPGQPADTAARHLAAMKAALAHHEVYEIQSWVGEGAGLGVAWLRGGRERRLAADPHRGRVGVLGGYVYDYPGSASAAAAPDPLGFLLGTRDDRGGPDPLALSGSYHAAVVEPQDGAAWIWVDEFGYRHLYYHVDAEGLMFAPEAKAILAVKRRSCHLDLDGVADYLNYGYGLGDRTYHREIKLMRPGTLLRYEAGALTVLQPFGPFRYVEEPGDDPAPYFGTVDEVYPDLLRRMARGHANVLVTLTGGLDSRFVLGQAVRAGLAPRCFTHGQRWCTEYKLASRLAAAVGARHDLIEIDPLWLPDCALEFVRYTEGQSSLRPALLLGVGRQYGLPPTETCFLNGIFGGPVNFGSGYFNARDLDGYGDDERRELDVMLRSLFAVEPDSPFWRCLRPEFRDYVRGRLRPAVEEELARHRQAGPHFYQQKDSFFIHNRLFRMMNAVDVNRYGWHDHFALVDRRLLALSKRLPARLKLGRRFFSEYIRRQLPELSRVPYKSTGVDLHSRPSAGRKRRLAVRHRVSRILERGSLGLIRMYDPEVYLHYDQWYRKHPAIREFYRSILLDPAVARRGFFDPAYLEIVLRRQDRGVDQGWLLHKLLALVIYLDVILGADDQPAPADRSLEAAREAPIASPRDSS
ncbi:MAG TPA: hypothetical protein PLL30_09660 [Candidatus Krumholzibacteria bacterium]|nr:hypothetical protein [Candidatus Krumholzibacteria bacterium]HPD72029.1 hypothetical protein [Candidatus Krumholzibacteria bacterium]HRY41038.1 hypothetical protein [Candidatus Krumholzibacteria bacterium]